MISLLGSLLGFGSSLIGPALDAWNKSSDQKHELAMLAAQADVQSKIQNQRLEATIVESEVAEIVAAHKEQAATVRRGPTWLAGLSGSVRPVITYLIIGEFLAINWAIAWVVVSQDGVTVNSMRSILDTEFVALVSTVTAFWFGNRTFGKKKT